MEEGWRDGRKEGFAKGLREGLEDGRMESARKMKALGLPAWQIREVTGFSEDEIV